MPTEAPPRCKRCRWDKQNRRVLMCVPCVNEINDELRCIGREEGYRRALEGVFQAAAQAYRRLQDDLAKHVRNLGLDLEKEIVQRSAWFKPVPVNQQRTAASAQTIDLQGIIPENLRRKLKPHARKARKENRQRRRH